MRQTLEVESLDTLSEELAQLDDLLDPDDEVALQELIRAFGAPREEFEQDEEFVREDEFICTRCHLVLHRNHAADWPRRVCVDCAAASAALAGSER